ncbi:hypothetical protein NUW46_14975 [Marinobacter sp. MA]|uniref:hypothetical protein n=1 Tax=Marinobacter sp. MA TaxID=2971606 RepID=UPI003AAA6A26
MLRFIVQAFVLSLSMFVFPAYAKEFDDWTIRDPLTDPKKIEAFIDHLYYSEVEALPSRSDLRKALPLIRSYGYKFQRLESCERSINKCVPRDIRLSKEPHYKVTRLIKFEIPGVEKEFQKKVREQEKDGCSFTKLPNPRILSITDQQIIFRAEYRHVEKWCDFGTKTTIGESKGYFLVYLRLNEVNSGWESNDDRGILYFSEPVIEAVETSRSFFGFLNANSVFGDLVKVGGFIIDASVNLAFSGLFEPSVYDAFNAPVRQSISYAYVNNLLNAGVSDVRRASDYIEKKGLLTMIYRLDAGDTRLYRDGSGNVFINVAYSVYVSDLVMGLYYPAKLNEKDFIENLGEPDKTRIIRAGESFWSIAEAEYGRGDFFYLLAAYNGVQDLSRPIFTGDTITVPPRFRLLDGAIPVLPDESIWSVWRELCPEKPWPSVRQNILTGSSSPDLIYPLQEISKICKK